MPVRLVSILGLGHPNKRCGYDPVVYAFEGRRAELTPLVARAHTELFAPVDSVILLGTRDVHEKRIATGEVAAALGRAFSFVEIPKGQDEGERWELFGHMRDALSLTPIAAAEEREAPDVVLFDVTHGFRTQPLFAMSVLSYMQAEWARSRAKAPTVRVLYGAYDPQNPPAPGEAAGVWDLTQQLTVTRWNLALDAFRRYGRADDLADLGREATQVLTREAQARDERGPALRQYGAVMRFGEVAKRFADDLALARFRDLLVRSYRRGAGAKSESGSAESLRAFLASEDARLLSERIPVLEDSLKRLEQWVSPLITERLTDRDAVRALAELARLNGTLQRFAEQVAAVREGTVLRYAVETSRAPKREPGSAGYLDEIDTVERELGAVSAEVQVRKVPSAEALSERRVAWTPGVEETIGVFGGVSQPRNDLLHGGLNDQPASSASLRRSVEALSDRFYRSAVEASTRFINLSNHSTRTWSPEQSEAARELGLGEPEDLLGGMPLVPPDADEDAVREFAEDLATRAVRQGARGAHVATDFTLTLALVGALRARGVRCFAATTQRRSVEVSRAGETVKESVFAFVRWREYRA